jgi:hypothetical protein
MSRNRIIYQSEALFTSPFRFTGVNGAIESKDIVNLQRVTDISTNSEITRENVNVFGRLANISREIIEEPTVSLDFTYYLADGFNESGLGFTTFRNAGNKELSCISGILANATGTNRNFYVLTVEEGVDANGINPQNALSTGKLGIIGIGNAFITNYTVNASVGEIPTADVSVEASNITFDLSSTSGFRNPSINVTGVGTPRFSGLVALPSGTVRSLDVNVIRPGDITLNFGSNKLNMGGAILDGAASGSEQTAHIQSFSLELPLSRTPLSRLGNSFAFSRELDVPIDVTLNVTANLADISAGSLNNLICGAQESRTITVKMYKPCKAGDDSELNLMFTLKGATLDSQNMSSTIGDPKTVELVFTSQIGGPNDIDKGLFISGRY